MTAISQHCRAFLHQAHYLIHVFAFFLQNEYFLALVGKTMPASRRPILQSYWPAKVRVYGKEHLGFHKLRKGVSSVNVSATCCNSLLYVDNPAHAGRLIVVMPESRVVYNGSAGPDIRGRLHIRDWSESDYVEFAKKEGKVLPTLHIDHETGKPVSTGDWSFMAAAQAEAAKVRGHDEVAHRSV